MKKILPVLLILIATGAGIGGGLMLRPDAQENVEACPCDCGKEAATVDPKVPEPEQMASPDKEYVKLNNQFVVPVLSQDRVASIVLLSLSLEVSAGERERIFAVEPKLRDAFLQTMFDHANMGGFEGAFTNSIRGGAVLYHYRWAQRNRNVAGQVCSGARARRSASQRVAPVTDWTMNQIISGSRTSDSGCMSPA